MKAWKGEEPSQISVLFLLREEELWKADGDLRETFD